jgi:hypothetical protein
MKTSLIVIIIVLTFIVLWRIISIIQTAVKNKEPPLPVPNDGPDDPYDPNGPNGPDKPVPDGPSPNGPSPNGPNGPPGPPGPMPTFTPFPTEPIKPPPPNTWSQKFSGDIQQGGTNPPPTETMKNFFNVVNDISSDDVQITTLGTVGLSTDASDYYLSLDSNFDYTATYNITAQSDLTFQKGGMTVSSQSNSPSISFHTGISFSNNSTINKMSSGETTDIINPYGQYTLIVTNNAFTIPSGITRLYYYIYTSDNKNFIFPQKNSSIDTNAQIVVEITITLKKN